MEKVMKDFLKGLTIILVPIIATAFLFTAIPSSIELRDKDRIYNIENTKVQMTIKNIEDEYKWEKYYIISFDETINVLWFTVQKKKHKAYFKETSSSMSKVYDFETGQEYYFVAADKIKGLLKAIKIKSEIMEIR
jgi:hypothetical protein